MKSPRLWWIVFVTSAGFFTLVWNLLGSQQIAARIPDMLINVYPLSLLVAIPSFVVAVILSYKALVRKREESGKPPGAYKPVFRLLAVIFGSVGIAALFIGYITRWAIDEFWPSDIAALLFATAVIVAVLASIILLKASRLTMATTLVATYVFTHAAYSNYLSFVYFGADPGAHPMAPPTAFLAIMAIAGIASAFAVPLAFISAKESGFAFIGAVRFDYPMWIVFTILTGGNALLGDHDARGFTIPIFVVCVIFLAVSLIGAFIFDSRESKTAAANAAPRPITPAYLEGFYGLPKGTLDPTSFHDGSIIVDGSGNVLGSVKGGVFTDNDGKVTGQVQVKL